MRYALTIALLSALPALGFAQTPTAGAPPPPPAPAQDEANDDITPMTPTVFGDTGLWFVPSGHTLPKGRWSVSGQRTSINPVQGFSNVAFFSGTGAVGIGPRVEIFGGWQFDTRIDRDIRPLFVQNAEVGGLDRRYPYVRTTWTGDNIGDLFLGAKVNLLAPERAGAFAVRGTVKLPTGDADAGVSTGRVDGYLDLIGSGEVARNMLVSGFGGVALRAKPDEPVALDLPNSFRWGLGTTFPSRSRLRALVELHGEVPFDDVLTASSPLIGVDGSTSPLQSEFGAVTTVTLGATWQARSGFFLGGAVNWDFPTRDRDNFSDSDGAFSSDFMDFQVRVGFHPGLRRRGPEPPPAPEPTPPPAPAPNQPPTVKASCDPCTVEVGRTSTVRADARDPDGDPLTYRWTAPTGSFANAGERQTVWTAPNQPGPVPVTVAVDDGRGGNASDNVTIQVTQPAPPPLVIEDVHFEFDQYNLTPEGLQILDMAVKGLQSQPATTLVIEGHTCDIGTAEYNLALGEARANAVLKYLASRGISSDRLRTTSFGEEQAKHDNGREETRRLNRRAAFVLRTQPSTEER